MKAQLEEKQHLLHYLRKRKKKLGEQIMIFYTIFSVSGMVKLKVDGSIPTIKQIMSTVLQKTIHTINDFYKGEKEHFPRGILID